MTRTLAVAVALLAITLSGCFGGTVPATELYRLDLSAGLDSAARNGAHALIPGTIAIARYATPGVYGGRGVVYRVEETEYGVYPNREWAIPLGEMLATLTEDVLTRDALSTGAAVYNPPSRRTFTYLWRGTVSQFEEVVRGKEVSAAVELEVRIVRIADDSVMWTGTQRRERVVPKPSMPAIVETLSSLSGEVVASLVQEARLAAPRIAADSAAARP
ncbi:MAG TPA: ABC-type transport auxiliary lipoprotein family protein [Gemmatimonadaceae bacterium]|nr:ABC-type transport auxiliary lipoprotein family protein [Gemmatimonadaceae bacterium]